MKKLLMLSCAILLGTTLNAAAEQHNKGGFQNNENMQMVSVAEIANLPDETFVVMQGNITGKTGSESYTFKDNSGTIMIEIDDDSWAGITITPNDIVIIEGEIDKNLVEPTVIEVDSIRMAD